MTTTTTMPALDFFDISEEHGERHITYHGHVYDSGDWTAEPYRAVETCFCSMLLSELVSECMKQELLPSEVIAQMARDCPQDVQCLDEPDMLDYIRVACDGASEFDLDSVDRNTPVGKYYSPIK